MTRIVVQDPEFEKPVFLFSMETDTEMRQSTYFIS